PLEDSALARRTSNLVYGESSGVLFLISRLFNAINDNTPVLTFYELLLVSLPATDRSVLANSAG
ncbi:MAG: hypothetical protein ACU84J_08790, partial [Gammaproteobacteria bacterium]